MEAVDPEGQHDEQQLPEQHQQEPEHPEGVVVREVDDLYHQHQNQTDVQLLTVGEHSGQVAGLVQLLVEVEDVRQERQQDYPQLEVLSDLGVRRLPA